MYWFMFYLYKQRMFLNLWFSIPKLVEHYWILFQIEIFFNIDIN
jgi:hypothetical protein